MGYIVERKRADGKSYMVRYRGTDRKLRSETFRSAQRAKTFLEETSTDIRRDHWVSPEAAKTTFAEVAQRWEATRWGVRPSTRGKEEIALRVHLLPRFGPQLIRSIDYAAIDAFIADSLEVRAPATVSGHLQVLSQIFKEALKGRILGHNPCDLVRGPGAAPRRDDHFLSPAEISALAEAIDRRYRAMVLVAGFRGLRWGEVAGLKVPRLNQLQATLQVKETLSEVKGKLSFGEPKTKQSIRTIKLPKFLVDALDDHFQVFPPRGELVFSNPDGSPLRRSNFARRIWKPAVRTANLDEGLTFHGLRHSAVSILISEGAQMVEIGAILGWSKKSIPQMIGRYGHLYSSRDDQLTDRLEQVYRESAHIHAHSNVLAIDPTRRPPD